MSTVNPCETRDFVFIVRHKRAQKLIHINCSQLSTKLKPKRRPLTEWLEENRGRGSVEIHAPEREVLVLLHLPVAALRLLLSAGAVDFPVAGAGFRVRVEPQGVRLRGGRRAVVTGHPVRVLSLGCHALFLLCVLRLYSLIDSLWVMFFFLLMCRCSRITSFSLGEVYQILYKFCIIFIRLADPFPLLCLWDWGSERWSWVRELVVRYSPNFDLKTGNIIQFYFEFPCPCFVIPICSVSRGRTGESLKIPPLDIDFFSDEDVKKISDISLLLFLSFLAFFMLKWIGWMPFISDVPPKIWHLQEAKRKRKTAPSLHEKVSKDGKLFCVLPELLSWTPTVPIKSSCNSNCGPFTCIRTSYHRYPSANLEYQCIALHLGDNVAGDLNIIYPEAEACLWKASAGGFTSSTDELGKYCNEVSCVADSGEGLLSLTEGDSCLWRNSCKNRSISLKDLIHKETKCSRGEQILSLQYLTSSPSKK